MYLIKNSSELASYIEFTNLSNIITENEMKDFLNQAKEYPFRSVVVSPTYVPLAKEEMKDTDTKVVTVIGFPLGFESTEAKVAAAKAAIDAGADEIDMVMNLSYIKDGKHELIVDEVSKVKEVIGDKVLKVIIETKALEDFEKANASIVIEKAGADYIKTATGFVTASHIYEHTNDINIIQKYAPKTKIKVAGGVNTYKLANQLLTAGTDLIGTSSGYKIVDDYKNLRKNTQVEPKPITFKKKD